MRQKIFHSTTLLLCVGLFILASGCTKNKTIGQLDLDTVVITPVTTPTQYRYGPCVGKLIVKINNEIGEKKLDQTMFVSYSVIQEQERLIWHMFIPEWIENGKHYKPRIPLVDYTMDTDLRGVADTTAITFPLIQSLGKAVPPETLAKLDTVKENLTSFMLPFPDEAIVTGHTLRTNKINNLPKEFTLSDPYTIFTLDGEFVHEGITYVRESINKEIPIKHNETGLILYINYSGYSIMRKSSMEEERSEMAVTIYDAIGKSHGKYLISTRREQ